MTAPPPAGLRADVDVSVGGFRLTVDLAVRPAETVAVLGPNGSGKSTLLSTIAGLRPIDAGCISIDGVVVDDADAEVFVDPADRAVGVVFQDYLLFDHLTAEENVAFGLRAGGAGRHEARAAARRLLDRVGLGDRRSTRPPELSGGQAQRVALARALATAPRLLLLDEPLAALDASTRPEVRRDLQRSLADFDGVRLLVTHDPVDAYVLADRVVVLDHGRVAQSGTMHDVTAHPRSRYVADLVGLNLVSGTVTGTTLTTAGGHRLVVADAAPGDAFAVIRPQAITVGVLRAEPTSARNSWDAVITEVDRLGDRARIDLDGPLPVTAEITVDALESLGLAPGSRVVATVKATEITTFPA
jgi:molybdate transport system ATP-binding protein